jgi:hypothetical protein
MSSYSGKASPNAHDRCPYSVNDSDGSNDCFADRERAFDLEEDGLEASCDSGVFSNVKENPCCFAAQETQNATVQISEVGKDLSSQLIADGLSGPDYETVFTNSKAGMDGVDKEYVKRIVFEMSKSSDFFRNEQRKEAAHRSSNEQLAAKVSALTATELSIADTVADRYIARAEASRDLSRRFIHVDMDMFFAAVEQLRRPELAELPMAVGGLGMISTANYVARKYGVRSAMPGFIGKVSTASIARIDAPCFLLSEPTPTVHRTGWDALLRRKRTGAGRAAGARERAGAGGAGLLPAGLRRLRGRQRAGHGPACVLHPPLSRISLAGPVASIGRVHGPGPWGPAPACRTGPAHWPGQRMRRGTALNGAATTARRDVSGTVAEEVTTGRRQRS